MSWVRSFILLWFWPTRQLILIACKTPIIIMIADPAPWTAVLTSSGGCTRAGGGPRGRGGAVTSPDLMEDTTPTSPTTAGAQPQTSECQGMQIGKLKLYTFNVLQKLTRKCHYFSIKFLFIRYFYDGGPDLTSTILTQCWRLVYLNCLKVNCKC